MRLVIEIDPTALHRLGRWLWCLNTVGGFAGDPARRLARLIYGAMTNGAEGVTVRWSDLADEASDD